MPDGVVRFGLHKFREFLLTDYFVETMLGDLHFLQELCRVVRLVIVEVPEDREVRVVHPLLLGVRICRLSCLCL